MNDEDIEYLKKCHEQGLVLWFRDDIAIHEPGALNKWRARYLRVTDFATVDGEPVAFLEDGTHATLWCVDRDELLIHQPIAPQWTDREE